MAEWTINAHSVLRDNEVLRDVSLWSAEDRASNPNAYYTIEVGIGSGDGKFDRLGLYDGSEDVLEGNATRSLMTQTGVARRLKAGDTLQINVLSVGTPDLTTAGLTVEWTLALAGGNSQSEKPLFATAGYLPDARVRAAVDGLTQRLNTSGVTEWTVAVPLQDPVGVADESEPYEPGSVVIENGRFKINAKRLTVQGGNRIEIQGDGRYTVV